MLTKALAIELAPFNIRVNCINPVVTDTAFLTKNIDPSKLEDARKACYPPYLSAEWAGPRIWPLRPCILHPMNLPSSPA